MRLRSGLAGLFAVALAASCGDDSSHELAGDWQLGTVGGANVPGAPFDQATTLQGSDLEIYGDLTFTLWRFRAPNGNPNAPITDVCTGTWASRRAGAPAGLGEDVTLTISAGCPAETLVGRWSGGAVLRLDRNGVEWVYRKAQ